MTNEIELGVTIAALAIEVALVVFCYYKALQPPNPLKTKINQLSFNDADSGIAIFGNFGPCRLIDCRETSQTQTKTWNVNHRQYVSLWIFNVGPSHMDFEYGRNE